MLRMSVERTVEIVASGEFSFDVVECVLRHLSNDPTIFGAERRVDMDVGQLQRCAGELLICGGQSVYECSGQQECGCNGVCSCDVGSRRVANESIGGGGVATASSVKCGGALDTVGDISMSSGKNRKNRAGRNARKKKQALMQADWRAGVSANGETGSAVVPDQLDKGAFWNSCSSGVRQELIDSKARMHIADNNRRAEEAERRVKQLQSPEQLIKDAVRIEGLAEKQGKSTSRINSWASSVARTYAEAVARSAPSTIQSYDSFESDVGKVIPIEDYNKVVAERDALVVERDSYKSRAETKVNNATNNVSAAKQKSSPRGGEPCSQEHFLRVTKEKREREEMERKKEQAASQARVRYSPEEAMRLAREQQDKELAIQREKAREIDERIKREGNAAAFQRGFERGFLF